MQEFRFELELTSPVVTQVEVTASEQEAEIRYVGIVGPQGEDGDAGLGGGGTAQLIEVTAGEGLSGDMLVMALNGTGVVLRNQVTEAVMYCCLGFTTASALLGEDVTVTIAGLHENAGWGLTPGAVYYAAANGGITAIPPVTGISQVVGVAIDANTLFVNINEPILMI